MENMIKKIVDADNEAKAMEENALKEKEELSKKIDEETKKIYDSYMKDALETVKRNDSLEEKKAEKLLSQANNGKWFKVSSDYSDNISFLVNGIPAVAISLLPSVEVENASQGCRVRTWEYLHTAKDNLETLWPESFELTQKILILLAKARFIIE